MSRQELRVKNGFKTMLEGELWGELSNEALDERGGVLPM
jgi:hypothetical protein